MKPLFLVLALLAAPAAFAQTPAPAAAPAGHDHGAEMPGLKKELFAGITEADFMKLGEKPKSVKITLVAAFNAVNYGMNFDGYSHGKAVFTVPKDWTVEVTFINPSPIPHSAIVVEKSDTKKMQMAEPYFTGAAIPKHLVGLTLGKADFQFVADEAGEYALACGFPAHALAGHWVAFNVSAEATAPTLQLGEQAVKEIK